MKDLREEVMKILKNHMWMVLSTTNNDNIPFSSVLVYQSDGNLIICQTGEETLKTKNIKNNSHVAITIPFWKNLFHKLIPAPPAEIHFIAKAEIVEKNDEEARTIFSKYLKTSIKAELPQDYIWIKIKVPSKVTTYGVGVPLLKMRNPKLARKIIDLN